MYCYKQYIFGGGKTATLHNLSPTLELVVARILFWSMLFIFHTLVLRPPSLGYPWVRPAGFLRGNLYLHSAVVKPLENVEEHYIGGELYSMERRPVELSWLWLHLCNKVRCSLSSQRFPMQENIWRNDFEIYI